MNSIDAYLRLYEEDDATLPVRDPINLIQLTEVSNKPSYDDTPSEETIVAALKMRQLCRIEGCERIALPLLQVCKNHVYLVDASLFTRCAFPGCTRAVIADRDRTSITPIYCIYHDSVDESASACSIELPVSGYKLSIEDAILHARARAERLLTGLGPGHSKHEVHLEKAGSALKEYISGSSSVPASTVSLSDLSVTYRQVDPLQASDVLLHMVQQIQLNLAVNRAVSRQQVIKKEEVAHSKAISEQKKPLPKHEEVVDQPAVPQPILSARSAYTMHSKHDTRVAPVQQVAAHSNSARYGIPMYPQAIQQQMFPTQSPLSGIGPYPVGSPTSFMPTRANGQVFVPQVSSTFALSQQSDIMAHIPPQHSAPMQPQPGMHGFDRGPYGLPPFSQMQQQMQPYAHIGSSQDAFVPLSIPVSNGCASNDIDADLFRLFVSQPVVPNTNHYNFPLPPALQPVFSSGLTEGALSMPPRDSSLLQSQGMAEFPGARKSPRNQHNHQ